MLIECVCVCVCQRAADLADMITRVIREGLEGLVLKDIRVSCLFSSNGHKLKGNMYVHVCGNMLSHLCMSLRLRAATNRESVTG